MPCPMTKKLIISIAFVLLSSIGGFAQERSSAVKERARLLEPFITESAGRYRIDARLLWTLCFVESRFKVDAVSPKGARGPMQFMPDTAARYGLMNPHDPKAAIDAGARYLRDLLLRFGGRVDLALAAYNSGEGAVESFLTGRPLLLRTGKVINPRGVITSGIPPYRETQNYVSSILRLSFGRSASSQWKTDRRLKLNSPSTRNSEEKISSRLTQCSFIEVEP
jgi:Transglycosylase SLT domain